MIETKTANRPAPWPQRFSAESLAPGVRRLLGTQRRGREGEQGAGQQPPARAEEVPQDIRKGARRCGGRARGGGASAPPGKRRRGAAVRQVANSRDAPLSVRSGLREADVFWAPSTARGASTRPDLQHCRSCGACTNKIRRITDIKNAMTSPPAHL